MNDAEIDPNHVLRTRLGRLCLTLNLIRQRFCIRSVLDARPTHS